MKKLILSIGLCFTLLFSSSAFAMDPKLKAIGMTAGYGVVGGALLGAASMAFGTNGRAIAKGASIGLYAGLLFGTYVIVSYEMKKHGYGNEQQQPDYYPDSKGQYEDQSLLKVPELNDYGLAGVENKKDPRKDPLFAMNFFNFNF